MMPLPQKRLEYLKVALRRESVEIEPNTFIGVTKEGDNVIVRLSTDVFAPLFDVHKTPTAENAKARTLLVRASEIDYRRMLKDALKDAQIAIPYRQLK